MISKFLERSLDEELLKLPLAVAITTMQGLVTFGSDDFLDFINAYFIEFGMMIFERCYMGKISEIFFEVIEVKLPKLINDFLMWLNNEVQEEVVNQEENLFGKKNRNEDSETSDSRVMLSDENSMQEIFGDESDKDRDQNIIF